MIELVIVSRLLEYPDAALWQHQQEMFEALASSEKLSKEDAHALGVFLRDLVAQDPLDAQAAYSELFDRGRATSLLLFEHVHGESRDRGQAMVDLMAQYERTVCCWIAMSCRIICRYIWSIWRSCRKRKRLAACGTSRRSSVCSARACSSAKVAMRCCSSYC